MTGMSRTQGRSLERLAHIEQSIEDILTTPIGTRVMRRDYGSLLPELIDQPLSDALMLRVYAASVMAIKRWEPRVRVTSVARSVSTTQPGRAVLAVNGQTTDGQPINAEVPVS